MKIPHSRFAFENTPLHSLKRGIKNSQKQIVRHPPKIPHDIIGDIAILKFPFEMKLVEKKKLAKRFLKEHKNVVSVLEKTERVKGRLRKAKTRFLAGENKKETIHKENGCKFLLNVDEVYFSSRLAEQRKIVAEDVLRFVKKLPSNKGAHPPTLCESGKALLNFKYNKISEHKASLICRRHVPKILVMFAGVGVFPIVIAKFLKDKGKKAEIISSEINRKANKYAQENVKLNHLQNYINVVQGDSRKLSGKLKGGRFDLIVMPRPNLKDTFLDVAMKLSKSGTKIYYHGFGSREDVLNEIKKEVGKKIGKIKIIKAGEIAPYKYRWLAEFSMR